MVNMNKSGEVGKGYFVSMTILLVAIGFFFLYEPGSFDNLNLNVESPTGHAIAESYEVNDAQPVIIYECIEDWDCYPSGKVPVKEKQDWVCIDRECILDCSGQTCDVCDGFGCIGIGSTQECNSDSECRRLGDYDFCIDGNCIKDCTGFYCEDSGPFEGCNGYGCFECIPEWDCTAWSDCSVYGQQTRDCADVNGCQDILASPIRTRTCTYQENNNGGNGGGSNGGGSHRSSSGGSNSNDDEEEYERSEYPIFPSFLDNGQEEETEQITTTSTGGEENFITTASPTTEIEQQGNSLALIFTVAGVAVVVFTLILIVIFKM